MLLLDDVMSELDKNRRMRLVSEISDYQTFITCTDESDLELDGDYRVYRVSAENGIADINETNAGEAVPLAEPVEPDFS